MKHSEYLLVFIYMLKQLLGTSYGSTVTSNFSSTNDAILRSIQQLNAKVEIIERNIGDILDIVIILADVQQDRKSCPNYWMSYEGSCYLFQTNVMNFVDSEEFCEEVGGHLVHVETALENDFIKGQLQNLGAQNVWMGLTDIVSESAWTWYGTHTKATFTYWAPGEPNNVDGDEDCAAFKNGVEFKWNDVRCSYEFRFVCEM